MAEILTEHYLESVDDVHGIRLSGHIDVLSFPNPGLATIADWKTGYKDSGYEDQLRGYAKLVFDNRAEVEVVLAWLVWLREGQADRYVFTRDEIDGWWERLAERIAGDLRYNPGTHCGYCKRAATCDARAGYLRNASYTVAYVVSTLKATDFHLPTTNSIRPFYDQVKAIEKLCDDAKDLIKSEVIRHGGKVPGLEIIHQARKSIDYPKAAAVLTQQLGAENVLPMLEIGKTKLEYYVRSTAERGQKSAAVMELMERLEAADAIQTNYVEKLEIRNVPNADAGTLAIVNATAGEAANAGTE